MKIFISFCFLPILYNQKVYILALNYFIIFLGGCSDLLERHEYHFVIYQHLDDFLDYSHKYLQPVFMLLEFIYQSYRRRLLCFK